MCTPKKSAQSPRPLRQAARVSKCRSVSGVRNILSSSDRASTLERCWRGSTPRFHPHFFSFMSSSGKCSTNTRAFCPRTCPFLGLGSSPRWINTCRYQKERAGDAAWLVNAMEDEMRAVGVQGENVAIVLFHLYLAYASPPFKLEGDTGTRARN